MFKRISVISLAVLVIGLFVLSTMYLVIDDATLSDWAKQKLAEASSIEISSQEPIHLTRTLSPTLSARGLLVRDPEKGFEIETSRFEMQVSLPALVFGKLDIRHLYIGESRVVSTANQAETEPTDLITLLRNIDALPLQPILHNLEIEQITFIREGHEEQLPELQVDQLDFRHAADKDVTMMLKGLQINGHSVDLAAKFPPLHRVVQDGKAPFTASVRYQVVELKATGVVDLDTEPATLSATLQLRADQLDQLTTGVENLVIPGTLAATASLSGSSAQLSMQDLTANWQGPNQSAAELKGGLGNLLQVEQIALQLNAKLVKPDWLVPLLPDDAKDTQNIDLASHISGSAETLALEEFRLRTLSADGLDQLLTGKLEVLNAATQAKLANLDQQYEFSAPTTIAARELLFPSVPEFGKISGRARVRSSQGHPALDNIEVTTRDEKGIRVKLAGSIASFPLESYISNDGYDLTVHIAADNTQLISGRMGMDIPISDPFLADFRIEGSTPALRLEKIALSAGDSKKVQLQATGYLHFGSWEKVDPVTDMHLDLRLNSQNSQELAKLLDQQALPELGPVRAQAKVRSQSGKHRIDDIRISTTAAAPLSAVVTGSATALHILPQFTIDGIGLDATADTQDVSVLQSVLKTGHSIPAIGPLRASATITGSSEALRIDNLSLQAGDSTILQLQAQGTVGQFSAAEEWHLKSTDLTVNASAPGSQAFADTLGYQIPDLGPISGKATITDKEGKIGILSAKLIVGKEDTPAVKLQGMIDSFLDPGTSHWTIELDISGQDFAAILSDETVPELGALRGKAIISDADGSTGIDSLQLSSNQPGILTIDIHGSFRDFESLDTLSFDSKVTARDLKLLEPLTGLPWLPLGPVEWTTRITHPNKDLSLTSSLTAEETTIDADIVGALTTTPPLFKGTIKANNMFISDHVEKFAQSARDRRKQRKAAEKKATKKVTEDSDNQQIFSRTPLNIDRLRQFDLDIDIDVPRFNRKYALADSGNARIVLKSGKLSIDPLRLNYGDKSLDARLQLDSNNTPSLMLKAFAEDLNPWRHLFTEDSKPSTDPFIHIDIDINTTGNSEHELASHAKGKAFVSMEHGRLNQDMLNLLFVDVIGWAANRMSNDKYKKINCGVADFTINDGVVSTRALLIDTDDYTVTGEGTVDLGQETVDYVMLPKKKSRVVAKAEPVKITGNLRDPKISALPIKSAAATYGSLIFGPVVFAGVFASQEILGRLQQQRSNKKESPCDKYKDAYEAMLASDKANPPASAP